MEYRICKTKYGKYKVQEYILQPKDLSFWRCFTFFMWIWFKSERDNCYEYRWKDDWIQITYDSLKEAEESIERRIEEDERLNQINNNEWECLGEY